MRLAMSLIAAVGLVGALLGAVTAADPQVRNGLLGLCILSGFIGLALLLPDFDGRGDEDWDSYRWPYW